MAIAGRVAIVPKGDWSADVTYKRLDAVTYNNALYFAKKDVPAGTATSNTEYWSKSIVGGAGAIATKEDAGNVKPADGLSIAEDGTLKVNIDGATLTMDQVNNVIKLADTLKEKINGAFPAANVVNNQITTETGYALDARQANPNIDGSLAKQISDLNGSLSSVTRIYGELIAGANLEMRAGSIYNAIYIFGKLVMISFSVMVTADLNNGQELAELPKQLQTKIEWNNLSGEILSTGYCPFVFSDNKQCVYIRTDNIVVHAGDEIRVWGIGFLR